MKKIIEIEACRDCSHVSPGGCAHEEIIKTEKNVKEIENWYSIPDWCPLEDAPLPERKEEK
jgi:hypothetical protein